jgi:hypothetical protein
MGRTYSTNGVIRGKIRTKETTRKTNMWVDNIKLDVGERGWVGVDWIRLSQDRDQWKTVVNTVMNLRVP